jgi:hypothetical protein
MDELVGPDDVRLVATITSEVLAELPRDGWERTVPGLEWSAAETLFHMARVPFSYATHLAARATEPTPYRLGSFVSRPDNAPAAPSTLLAAMTALCHVLADVVTATPPGTRAYHPEGMADRSGFAAMGCDEVLIHTDDILRAYDRSLQPPGDLVARVLARLFPWAPTDVDPWTALRWANGREELPRPYGRLGPDWHWHCAPLEQWDGTSPVPARTR